MGTQSGIKAMVAGSIGCPGEGQMTVDHWVRIKYRNLAAPDYKAGESSGHKPEVNNSWSSRYQIKRQGQHQDTGQGQQQAGSEYRNIRQCQDTSQGQLTTRQKVIKKAGTRSQRLDKDPKTGQRQAKLYIRN